MAARKLQTEIDRTLKKVSEGVELFEGIYDKMQASTNQTQKEKLELDLKTQIKKLQRLRDQIKTWVASNDIKDKSQLLDNRRLIETQMEKFKACEKEMKTKAFSKEGLTQAAKLDPKEQEKEEAMQWLQSMVEELQMQVEAAEAQVEALQGQGKKKKSSNTAGRMEELEQLNDRRKWHISRLEIVLRLLNNGSLTTDRVNALKEDVQYFVESNTEEDFEEDEGIYDELRLDEEEEKFGLLNEEDEQSEPESEDLPPRTPLKHKHDKEKEKEKDIEPPSHKREQESPILKKANISLRKSSVDAKPPPNFVQQPMSSILKAGLGSTQPAPRPPTQLPPIKYAAMAAAALSPSASATTPSATSTAHAPNPSTPITQSASQGPAHSPSIPPSMSDQQSHAPSSPSFTQLSVTSPMLSSAASVSNIPDGSLQSAQQSPSLSEAVTPSSRSGSAGAVSSPQKLTTARKDSISSLAQAAPSAPPGVSPQADTIHTQQPVGPVNGGLATSPLPQQIQASFTPATPGALAPSPVPSGAQPAAPPGVKPPPQAEGMLAPPAPTQQPPIASPSQQQPQQQRNLTSLSDLVVSYENAKQKANVRMSNLDQVHKMLEGGYSNLPQPSDTDKPKYYVPRNPYQTPTYYPQVPHPFLSTPRAFTSMDVETLFYVFYYLPGTYQQFLAARELKRQSWRFHVKYLTWFQRHSEPQAITEEYEQGVYVYFDWEGSWCQRKKSDFRFEYRYLSED